MKYDALEICKKLVGYNSVTYTDSDILSYASELLYNLGFKTEILEFVSDDGQRKVQNLFATRGDSDKCLGILGHLDTVPAGIGWLSDPFVATERNGQLYGRGIADMKGGAGCILAALSELENYSSKKINVFFTCDEEVGSYEGTQALLDWAVARNEIPTDCLICEPSSKSKVGDRIYIGHRGSINITAEAAGTQMHSAYINKDTTDNALEKVCDYISKVSAYNFGDIGSNFEKTIASLTMLETPNLAVNIIPAYAKANFNVRFSDQFSSDDIIGIFRKLAADTDIQISYMKSGEPYICKNQKLLQCASKAIKQSLGYEPELSTGGGTSDGRFMIKHCPVIELGMVDATLHQVNEHVEISACNELTEVYKNFIKNYFE